jgi:hypothetical protein
MRTSLYDKKENSSGNPTVGGKGHKNVGVIHLPEIMRGRAHLLFDMVWLFLADMRKIYLGFEACSLYVF